MNDVLLLGPLALPWSLVLILLAVTLSLLWAGRLGRRTGVDVESPVWQILLVALVAARLGFVAGQHEAFLAAPLSVLDIRDGGWSPVTGLVAGTLMAVLRTWRRPALRGPLWRAVGAGVAVWLLGTAALLGFGRESLSLPPATVADLHGDPVGLERFRGRVTVVNLWATWCPPCRREMPVLQQAQRDHPEVHIVLLNQGETADQVRAYLAGSRLELNHVLLDHEGRVGIALGRMALPTTLFFDAEGRLVERRVGEVSAATLARGISRSAAQPATGADDGPAQRPTTD